MYRHACMVEVSQIHDAPTHPLREPPLPVAPLRVSAPLAACACRREVSQQEGLRQPAQRRVGGWPPRHNTRAAADVALEAAAEDAQEHSQDSIGVVAAHASKGSLLVLLLAIFNNFYK